MIILFYFSLDLYFSRVCLKIFNSKFLDYLTFFAGVRINLHNMRKMKRSDLKILYQKFKNNLEKSKCQYWRLLLTRLMAKIYV